MALALNPCGGTCETIATINNLKQQGLSVPLTPRMTGFQ
jgi:hypothetical protein